MKKTLITLLILLSAGFSVKAQQWALPKVSVAILRSEPRHAAEQISQVVTGTPLKVIETGKEWWKIETPEGYVGYVRNNTLHGLDDAQMELWKQAARVVVTTDATVYAMKNRTDNPEGARLTDLVNGAILEVTDSANPDGEVGIKLPDGREGYISASLLTPIEQWATQVWNPADMPLYASRMEGTPYVWGGTSSKGMDCSGLTQICAYRQGVMLPRDASQQVNIGIPVNITDSNLFKAGDLLFFGNVKTGRVNHVAISCGGATYIHSSARVRVSSLDKSSPIYENSGLIAVRRIDNATALTLSLKNHPRYFSDKISQLPSPSGNAIP